MQGDVVVGLFGYLASSGDPTWPIAAGPSTPGYGFPAAANLGEPTPVQVRVWRGFSLVVSHSCDLGNRNAGGEADPRILVAPIYHLPVGPTRLNTGLIFGNRVEYALPLPDLPPNRLVPGHEGFPASAADLRGIVPVSRTAIEHIVLRCSPGMALLVQTRLSRFFSWRDLSKSTHLELLTGRTICAVGGFEDSMKGGQVVVRLIDDCREEYAVTAAR